MPTSVVFNDGGASIAIASAAAAQAAQAEQQSRHAECMVIMHGYQDTPSTTLEARREYAGCVYDVYGNGLPLPPIDIILVKIAIVACLIGAAIGGWHSWKDSYGGALGRTGDTLVGVVVGAIAAAVCMFCVSLVAIGIGFLIA